jgi:hypothetical protein
MHRPWCLLAFLSYDTHNPTRDCQCFCRGLDNSIGGLPAHAEEPVSQAI